MSWIRLAGDISVHVISGDDREAPPARGAALAAPSRFRLRPYVLGVGYVGIGLGFAMLLLHVLDVRNWRWCS